MFDFLKTLVIEFWATFTEMSPYLLFGFLIAGLLSVFISARMVERHLGRRGFWQVFKASLFGVPLPLCSCGVIPVSMSLSKHGASKGATLSFLLSTPQTGVDSILVTYSLLGPFFAVIRPVVALITGLIGGQVTNWTDPERKSDPSIPVTCQDECCSTDHPSGRFKRIFRHGFVTLPADIGRSMLVGLVIAALITASIPDDYFAVHLAAGGGLLAMLLMMVLGIPVYVCATASVPVAAALIEKGLSPGAALVFLMTGPATNAAAITTLWSRLGPRTAMIYLLTVAGCALAAGLVVDRLIGYQQVMAAVHTHRAMLPGWVQNLSALGLLAVLLPGIFKRKHPATSTEVEENHNPSA